MENINKMKETQEEIQKLNDERNELQKNSFCNLLSSAITMSTKKFKQFNVDVAYGFLIGCLTELIAFNKGLKAAEQEIKKKVETL